MHVKVTRHAVHRGGLKWFTRLPKPLIRVIVRFAMPSYTVSAMVVLRRADGRVLIVRHSYNKEAGLPGGLADRGEPVADAAVREVREEVGIDVDLVGPPLALVDPDDQVVRVVFEGRPRDVTDDGSSARPVSAEIAGVEWIDPDRRAGIAPEAQRALDLVCGGVDAG